MTTYQSTSLHVEDADEKSLAFTVADNPGEDDYALKAWSTFILPDNQVVNVEVKFAPDDVRDLQAFLRDRFGAGVRSQNLADHRTPEEQAQWAASQKPSDDTVASFFQDGWMASLRELLEMSKVRGYEDAIAWAKNQLGAYVGPAALQPVAPEQIVQEQSLAEAAYAANEQAARALDVNPATGLSVNPWPDGPQLASDAPRQCPVIFNSVQCLKSEGHDGAHDMYQHAPMTGDGSTVNAAPAAAVDTEPSEAEKGRRRRLKVEMEFDDALEAHLATPTDETWNRLSEAFKAVHKREPDNSRVRVPLAQRIGASSDAAPTLAEAQRSEPTVGFAPEPPAGTPVAVGANYLAQAQHPINQQFHEAAQALPGVHVQDSVIMTPEQAAAAAFPCPQHSVDGRQCQRPFGHELQTATNPEPKPHVYATIPSQLPNLGYDPSLHAAEEAFEQSAPSVPGVTGAQAVQAAQQNLPAFQGAGHPAPTAPLSFQVPPTPGPAPVQIPADANQQPPAPAAPFWQQPQPQGGQ